MASIPILVIEDGEESLVEEKEIKINTFKSLNSVLVPRRYEFQMPSATTSSLLGAELSSTVMAPPKLNTVKKSRFLVNPGKSMVEWMKIQKELSSKAQPVAPRKIGIDELAKHNTAGDVWMAINDKVFDVSDYLHYHPGGAEELMKGAGQDATSLFNQIHRWINFESILKANFLGFLVNEPTFALIRSMKSQVFLSSTPLPTTKFSEDDDCVFLEIDSHVKGDDIRQDSWTIGLLNRERLILKVMVKPSKIWVQHLRLLKALTDDHININYENNFKRVLLTLKKPQQGNWLALGAPLANNNQIMDSRIASEDLYHAKIYRKKKLTHNVCLYTIVTETAIIGVPLGCHLQIRLKKSVCRQYTPVVLSIMAENNDKESSSSCQTFNNGQELHFIIKIYPDGQLTSLLNEMIEECDTNKSNNPVELEIGSPGGNFDIAFLHGVNTLCLLAGGTGITPFIRIIQYLHQRRKSIPIQRVLLIFFNETSNDIIWKKEFEEFACTESNWFYFYPVITKSGTTEEWSGLTGRITPQLFENCIRDSIKVDSERNNNCSKAMICGSFGFNAACKQTLREQTTLRIDDPQGIHIFTG